MKKTYILAASIAALSMIQDASAATGIRLTGSTAFRSATVNAIKNVMTFSGNGEGYGYVGTSFTGAASHIFIGKIPSVSATEVFTIKTNWSGSGAGIRDVSVPNNLPFIADGTTVSPSGTPNLATSVSEAPEIAMSDNKQSSTTFLTPNLNIAFKVGIIPFAYVASKDTPAGVTNMTAQNFKALYNTGRIAVSFFTNNPADTQYIYAVGRDPFSGTRLDSLAEPGYGTQNVVRQYKPTLSTTAGSLNTVLSIAQYPPTASVPDAGNDGESSGGTVGKFLRYTTMNVTDTARGTTAPTSFIGYVGEADSYTAVFDAFTSLTGADQGNARYLSFNGVAGYGGTAKKPATVSVTNGSPVVGLVAGALNDTTGLVVGQVISGNGIAPGASILSINAGANTITLDRNSTVTDGALAGVVIGALLPSTVRNGTYTFWNYEQMLWKSSVIGTSGFKFSGATAIKNRILNFDYSFAGLADDASMTVSRDEDGGFLSQK